ncbi:MAG: triose-phosphate isomerase [Spirosomataceae bacterium]
MRKKIVAGNWKMNKTIEEAIILTSEVANMVRDEVRGDVEVILCTPYIYLPLLQKYIDGIGRISLSAQNCHQKPSGAYTGEISAGMLAALHIPYTLIGHSERRQYFGETDELLAEKVKLALANGIKPIFCCGELLEQRQNEDFISIVKAQITTALFDLSVEDFRNIVIAYEPVWAIGTGLTASSAQAQEMHAALRAHIATQYGEQVADDTTILYGGSCNEKNAAELFACSDVDGGLIGGASLKSREFTNIIKARM